MNKAEIRVALALWGRILAVGCPPLVGEFTRGWIDAGCPEKGVELAALGEDREITAESITVLLETALDYPEVTIDRMHDVYSKGGNTVIGQVTSPVVTVGVPAVLEDLYAEAVEAFVSNHGWSHTGFRTPEEHAALIADEKAADAKRRALTASSMKFKVNDEAGA